MGLGIELGDLGESLRKQGVCCGLGAVRKQG